MPSSLSGQGRRRRPVWSRSRMRAVALATVAMWCAVVSVPDASAMPASAGGVVPSPKMFGYAAGPAQHIGTAAGKPHYVPASATRAAAVAGRLKGHRAPVPALAPPAVGSRTLVTTGPAPMAPGHLVAGTGAGAAGSPQPGASPSPSASSSPSSSASPSASPSPSTSASLTAFMDGGGTDNASYSVASTFDTVPMADQTGRIAVTLTNTGTSTWSGYALGSQVFPSGDTNGTGTPLTTGANVAVSGTVAPGGTATVESVTPAENPGSYEICWDMVNASGTYFAAEGANEYCAPYTIQQYPPQINEQEPLPGTDVDTQTPQLSASAVVPGGYPANPVFSYAFKILNGPNPATATVVASSGWVANSGNSWTPTTSLTWGTTYYWQVTVSDAVPPLAMNDPRITWTTPISFVVGNAQQAVSYRLGNAYQADDGNPIMTSSLGGTDYSGSGKTVDQRTGNVSQQASDAIVGTVGPPLSIVRTYNSLDPRTSQALGAGWSSLLDMSLVPDPDGSGALILTLAHGQQVRFAKNSAGGYAPPQDMDAVVSALSGGGFAVTDQTGTTYQLGQASGSSWLISAITDNTGKAETFSYSSGTLATITSTTSGRALHLTWSTPSGAASPHVATVSTDPVTAGQPGTALTWTYGYTGDLLTSVCPPGTTSACTSYGYITNGSHAATSVLNADPTSYYRLDDPAGATVAANQIPVNDMTTVDPPASEFSTTLGAAGPVTGVTATSFNGTSSWIPLDGGWCTTPGQESSCKSIPDTGRVITSGTAQSLAVSVWFKTSTASGVLLGLATALPPSQNCNPNCFATVATPMLWIASNGHLDGYGGSSIAAAMTSPAAVNNGAWHQVVLIPGQAMYLDGAKVATATAGFTVPNTSVYALLGAGLIPGNQTSSSWSYFNGSIADLSFYHNQLPSTGTVAAQYAAETHAAAELNSVTSPAGRSELSATYDTVNDRVTALTDAAGGTWHYSGPAPGASSAAYDSAVMGSSPVDFWPLNDTSGPLARDMTGSAADSASPRPAATYANVTLGAAGPDGLADGNAAAFGGTSSQVSIPGGYFGGTGAESAELWFSTTGHGTVLSSGSGQNGEPMALWVPSGYKCLEGTIGSTTLNAPLFGSCSGNVADGKWHQAVLTMSAGTICPSGSFTCTPGSFSQTATLYVDGKSLATTTIPVQATASATGYTADIGNGPNGDFTGSIADVSLYTTQLSSTDVAAHYQALRSQNIPTGVTPPATPPVNIQTVTVTDPASKTASYVYATGALVRSVSVLGGVTSYGYDAALRASAITDPDGDTTYVTYDAHNNVSSTTTCAAINNCQTAYSSYYENLSNPLDPRNDKPTDSRDARSSSPYDPAYDTVTTYTSSAQIATRTTPPATACPSGCKTSYAYTTGSEAAVGGGTEPAGLLASITAPGGGVTSYAYDSAGDVMQTTNPLGLMTNYAYDNLGRELTEAQISNTFPAGLTTGFSYDGQDRLVTQTDQPVTDRVTGAVHTKVTSRTYDADSNALTTTISDTTGGDPSRTVTNIYNSHGQLASTADALGNTSSYTYDAFGNRISQTNPAGVTTAYTYDDAGNLLTTTLQGYTGNPSNPSPPANLVQESRAYDPAGRLASVINVKGTQTNYTYYADNRLASSYVVCPSCGNGMESVNSYGYDAAGNRITESTPGGLVVNTNYNAASQVASQTVDPSGVDRTVAATYDADGNVVAKTLTGGGVTQTQTMAYNAMDQELAQTVDNTGGNLTTRYVRDQRGLVTSETDPAGNITTIANDEAGRPVVETAPAVPSQTGSGGASVTANPVTTTGYDTFGDQVESSDPNGNVTTYAYDQDGHLVSSTDPSYTPPGATTPVAGSTTSAYNNLGEETSTTDPLGNVTQMTYDQLGDLASQTDPGSGVTTFTYDPAGEQTSVTDLTGAQTDIYDANGELVTQDLPGGVQVTSSYDAMGDMTGQSGAGAAAPTAARTFTYDGAGRLLTAATGAAGTSGTPGYQPASSETFGYDDRGLLLSASGSAGTSVFTYNGSGQLATAAEAAGTSTYAYDSAGRLATNADAASGVTGAYAYNNLDQVTGISYGTGNDTRSFGYDSLHRLTSDTIATAGATQVASIGYGYDASNDVTSVTTSGLATPGGGTGTVTNAYGYDQASRLTSWTATPSGGSAVTKTYGYDDAGNLTSNNGTTFSYDARNELTSDGSSTYTYTYTADGDLATGTGPGGTSSYASDAYGQQVIDAASSLSYDALGRMVSDANQTSGGTIALTYDGQTNQVASDASASYSRDPAGQITGVSTAGGTRLLALSNQHEDLSGTFAAAGTSLAGSATYDPWGQVLAGTGPAIQVGYQGQWTDPGTGQVDMGARFYKPSAGGFINQDTYAGRRGGPAVAGNLHAYADDNPMSVTDPSGHAPSASSGASSVSAAEIAGAAARAAEAHAKALAASAAAVVAAGMAASASAAAHGAAALARLLNTAAAKAAQAAAKASQLAAAAFRAAQAQLQAARAWQDKANAAWRAARDDLSKSHGWNPFSDAKNLFEAGVQTGIALYDEGRATAAMIVYGTLEVLAFGARAAADLAEGMAQLAAQLAKGAAKAAELAARLADAAVHYAQYMASVAAQDWAIAGHYAALVAKLTAAYAKQMARKVAKAARAVGRVLKKVAKKLARAAVAVAKAAYKYSGAQDVVSCVTHPQLSSCLKAALTVVLVVGTGGEGEAEVAALDAAEQAGAHAAEEAGGNAVKDAAESCVTGGMSFTAATKVLLASGKAVPIASLKPGEKVLATDTRTGKTRAETISVVMVHHDTNLYDLKIKVGSRTAVIGTTSNHPFWDATARRWVKAAALKYGTRLRTPAGGTATVLGGYAPRHRSGWMWDLTIPGDHDFYVIPAIAAEQMTDGNRFSYNATGGFTAVLVHNCNPAVDFAVPKRPGVYTVHTYSGDKYIGSATWSMRERVADVLSPRHAFTRAGYTCEDICNVTWIELSRGVSSITARRVEQTVMEGWKSQGFRLLNIRDPEIDVSGMGSF